MSLDAEHAILKDEFLSALIASESFLRLKNIGFLGTIDHVLHGNGREWHRRRHSRYEHSLAVARLAMIFAREAKLSTRETRILVGAALLHDIGHGPLSHSLEPIFERYFGVTHHRNGRDIIRGRNGKGEEISNIARIFRVDIEEIIAMLYGNHDAKYAFIFSSTINLDTIEGITRTHFFFLNGNVRSPSERIVREFAIGGVLPTPWLDEFWHLKNITYRTLINGRLGALFDGLARGYMEETIDQFSPAGFSMTEEQFRRRHQNLFKALYRVTRGDKNFIDFVGDKIAYYEDTIKIRKFEIENETPLNGYVDLPKRYRQKKNNVKLKILDLAVSVTGKIGD